MTEDWAEISMPHSHGPPTVNQLTARDTSSGGRAGNAPGQTQAPEAGQSRPASQSGAEFIIGRVGVVQEFHVDNLVLIAANLERVGAVQVDHESREVA